MNQRSYASLSRTARRLEALLAPALAAPPFWLRAELSSANDRRGNLYCDLVETQDGQVVARLRCHIWSSDLAAIRRRFERHGIPLTLADGTEVGIQCRVEFHPVHGLALRGIDMDPEFALGALERRRREILDRLTDEQLLERNRARRPPLVPNRIGLVASRDTAGYHDFVTTLARCGIGVDISFADARVQGDDTERSVCRALDCLAALDVDLVVVVRGGGSRIDLSYLDNEVIARRIAAFPVQVWTGIGHDTDRSVVDEVAARSFKTPTAVAEAISEQLLGFERWLGDATRAIALASRLRIEPERRRLDQAARMVRAAAVARVNLASQILGERDKSLKKTVKRLLDRHRTTLSQAAERLRTGAVASRLTREAERLAFARRHLVGQASGQILGGRHAELAAATAALRRGAGYLVRGHRAALDGHHGRFRRERFEQRLAQAAAGHEQWERALRAADPELALARGYSLTYADDGMLLRSVATLAPGTRLRTRLVDGVIVSEIESIESARSASREADEKGIEETG